MEKYDGRRRKAQCLRECLWKGLAGLRLWTLRTWTCKVGGKTNEVSWRDCCYARASCRKDVDARGRALLAVWCRNRNVTPHGQACTLTSRPASPSCCTVPGRRLECRAARRINGSVDGECVWLVDLRLECTEAARMQRASVSGMLQRSGAKVLWPAVVLLQRLGPTKASLFKGSSMIQGGAAKRRPAVAIRSLFTQPLELRYFRR